MSTGSQTDGLRETLDVFEDPGVPLTTPEVAGDLDLGRRSTYNRLTRLVENERIETKKVGANARVWWRSPTNLDTTGSPGADATGSPGADATGSPDADETGRRNAEGTLDRVAVADQDVTGRERTERKRADLERELDEVFERVDDGFFALDEEFRFVYVNDTAAEYLGETERELLGRTVRDALDVADDDPIVDRFEAAVESGEPTGFERYWDRLGAWTTVQVSPSPTGLSVYFRDVTERKEREEQLQRYVGIVDAVGEPVYELDAEGRFTFVNEAFVDQSGYDRSELLGEHVSIGMDEGAIERVESEILDLLGEPREDSTAVEYDVRTKGGDRIPVENRISLQTDETGRVCGSAGMLRDVSERRERERKLERYEQLVETVWDGVYALDEDERFVLVNEAFCDLVGYERSELLGEHATLVGGETVNEAFVELAEEIVDGDREVGVLQYDLETADGGTVPVETRFGPFEYGDGRTGRCGVTRDVTERKRFEETLVALYESTRTLFEAETAETVDELLVESVVDVLGLPAVGVYRRDPGADVMYPAAATVEGGFVAGERLPAVPADDSSATGRAYGSGTVQAVDDVTELSHVDPEATDMRGGLFVPMGDHGVLAAGSPEEGGIDEDKRRLVELLATNAEAAYDRVEREVALREHERELERQRHHLAALDDLNEVVRDITDAVIDQSSREEIESIVCERLAAADSYEFAWVGEVDPASRRILPNVEAGVDGYLDDAAISIDPDEPKGQGPGGRAARTREIQFSQNALSDPEFDPWREQARKYGYRSAAAIPIVHGDNLYGLLGVYADRPDGFGTEERAVIGQLGEVVGHAIAAIDRKRALTSDEVTEIELAVPDYLGAFGVAVDDPGTITFDRAVSTGDDGYLEFGTVDAAGRDTLETLVDSVSHFEDVRFVERGEDRWRFELQLSEPPIVSVVASHGGYLERATMRDGEMHLTIHVPATVDARRLLAPVRETFPGADLLRRRQRTRDDDALPGIHRAVTGELTERQRTALEVAVYSGFFEWPREATGQEVAESLGIAAPTFSQHLRKAQRQVFESLFGASTPP